MLPRTLSREIPHSPSCPVTPVWATARAPPGDHHAYIIPETPHSTASPTRLPSVQHVIHGSFPLCLFTTHNRDTGTKQPRPPPISYRYTQLTQPHRRILVGCRYPPQAECCGGANNDDSLGTSGTVLPTPILHTLAGFSRRRAHHLRAHVHQFGVPASHHARVHTEFCELTKLDTTSQESIKLLAEGNDRRSGVSLWNDGA